MHPEIKLTIQNWESEHQRLKTRYRLIKNKNSLEAQGILDHILAVRQIIKEIEDKQQHKDGQVPAVCLSEHRDIDNKLIK